MQRLDQPSSGLILDPEPPLSYNDTMDAYQLDHAVQYYDWGSRTHIPNLLGISNDDHRPYAELWMGAHPALPSQIVGQNKTLLELINQAPQKMLGTLEASRFDNRLPFLLKALAASRSLSIQAHPSLAQAREGFARENQRGLALDAPERNYKDANHKPELIYALTEFKAMRGFKKTEEIIRGFKRLDSSLLKEPLELLKRKKNGNGLKSFFKTLMAFSAEERRELLAAGLKAYSLPGDELSFWIQRLSTEHPHDLGALSPLLLNLVTLQPGQAMFLGPGVLHAYLEGFGIEIMANSDNVLRGGLTSKHVDVEELVRVLDFNESKPLLIEPQSRGPGEDIFHVPVDDFYLSVITLEKKRVVRGFEPRGPEILLCRQGSGSLYFPDTSSSFSFSRGDSYFIPAESPPYHLSGSGRLFKAGVPGKDLRS